MATASAFSSLRFSLRTQHRQHKHKHVVRVSKANTHCQSCSCTLARCCRRRHCLLDRTHTHTQAHNRHTRTQRRAHSLTRWRRNNCAIKKGWYEAEAHKLPAVRVRWLYNTQFSSGELCAASAPLSLCACAGRQAYNACVLCVFVYCGELLWKSAGALSRCTKWGPGPSE